MMLETEIANYIDDLLVANKLEEPRKENYKCFNPQRDENGDYCAKLKQPARLTFDINFADNYASVRYNGSFCWFHLQSGCVVFQKMLKNFPRKLVPLVKKAILKYQKELKEEYKEWKDIRSYKIIKPETDDDFDDYKNLSPKASDGCKNMSLTNKSGYKNLFSITKDCELDIYGIGLGK